MKQSFFLALGLASVACTFASGISGAQGAAVTITNFSFENPVEANDDNSTFLDNQTAYGFTAVTPAGANFCDIGIENPNEGYSGAAGAGTPTGANGTNVLFINDDNVGNKAYIYQNVGMLLANTTYTFTVAIGARTDRINEPGYLTLINTAAGVTTDAGTTLSTTSGISSVPGSFQDFSTTYTTGATVSGNLTIELYTIENGDIQASFDNLRLTATSAVPEPSSVAACLVGAAGIAGWIRRRR